MQELLTKKTVSLLKQADFMKTEAKKQNEKAIKILAKTNVFQTAIKNCKQDKELELIVEKKIKRANKTEISVKKWIDNRLIEKLQQISRAMPSTGYSMGEKITVKCCGLVAYSDRRQEYARSSKFKATHGYYTVNITSSELRNISIIGGLVTFIKSGQKSKVKRCWWFDKSGSKNYFQLKKVEGFICNGYHHENKKIAQEQGEVKEKRDKQQKDNEKKFNKAMRLQYSYNDSLLAGNCEAGSRAFIMRLKLDSEKLYRGSYLLKLANEKSTSSVSYINRMISYKANLL